MIYHVHHLNCGSFCPHCAPLFGQKGLRANIPCHCLLLETDRGLVLIDSGLGLQDYQHMSKRLGLIIKQFGNIQNQPELSAIKQIKKLGFDPKDVQHILVSHLDFDHAGGISDFPWATVHVLASEYNAAMELKKFKDKIRYRPDQFKQHRYWNFIEPSSGEAWFNLSQAHGLNLFEEDILMIPLLGHSAGHSGIAIQHDHHWILYCGDAYFSHKQLVKENQVKSLERIEQILAYDNSKRLTNLHKLQQLNLESQVELICAHDPDELSKYRICNL